MSATRSATPVVVCDGVSKTFRTPHERRHTLKERALHPFHRSGYNRFDALQDVSFAIDRGEFFGIVGRNGSGKSTLLKILAGIYRADRGEIRMSGRLSTFIELGVGFNAELAARDNVLINGIMLGLSPREALRRFDQIIEFAELEEFVDLKLKNYSTGMQVRLAFSVMVHVDADILLIDEVLAVGDAGFQQKCFDVFHRLRDEGKTILFVTHDMGAVARFCDRAMLLEKGEQRLIGEPERVGRHYLELNFGRDATAAGRAAEAGEAVRERFGSQAAEITDAWFEDHDGQRSEHLSQGSMCSFRMRVRFNTAVERPNLSVVLENEDHVPLFATSSWDCGVETGTHAAGDEWIFTVSFTMLFRPSRIWATPWLVEGDSNDVLDRRPRMCSAVVSAVHDSGGVVNLPHTADYTPVAAAAVPTAKP
jgi:ABC-type polysaccharide/polyol phosphate transport system ATPase subunit